MKTALLHFIALAALTTAARSETFLGNGSTGFGGPVGNGSLTLTTDGTTLFGTISTPVSANTIGDELVIYIDSVGGGFTSTATFDDTDDILRRAMSGFDGTTRSTLEFAGSFAADYAIAIGPNRATFGGLWLLAETGAHTFVSSVNLTPTTGAGPYQFSLALDDIGAPTSFAFATTYGNFGTDIFRSGEAYNSISGAGNPGAATATAGFNTFSVIPEPANYTTLASVAASIFVLGLGRRRRQAAGL
ncbi:MAG: hypothetical protein ABII82_16550 [Verrucomicrobiota bacterium]